MIGRRALLAVALAAVVLPGCGAPQKPPPRMVSLRFTGGAPNATMTIDDIAIGPFELIARRGIALPAGEHRISVEANGYFPWDKIVAAETSPTMVDVRMIKIPE